jgi:PiT family inorganic phosphate transporter
LDVLIDGTLGASTLALVAFGLLFALAFEFANGFHDTANAVATVIYTHSLPPTAAVVWSGLWNFIGVLVSSGAVAFGIVNLLPADLVVGAGSGASFAMVFALLGSAIMWNVGTWYLGLPASSSHTLIGSIIGVGITHSLYAGDGLAEGVNWSKLGETMMALLVSPVIGFTAAGLLLLLARPVFRNPALHRPASETKAPPLAVRAVLIATCTGVSFTHGSNDGQKGMGLIMLVLIALAPAAFALQLDTPPAHLRAIVEASRQVERILHVPGAPAIDAATAEQRLDHYADTGRFDATVLPALAVKNDAIVATLSRIGSLRDLTAAGRSQLRSDVYWSTSRSIT